MADEKKRFIIIDSNSVIHRAFHALPSLSTKNGEAVNAVYGFLLVFLKIIKEFKPEFVFACFDAPGPTFRHKKFKEYKAKRPPAPKELYDQIPKVKEILNSFSVPIFEKQGFEGDDLVGTIANLIKKKQAFPSPDIIIVSGDTDLLQLVDENVKVYLLKRGVKETILYNAKLVKEKYNLEPKQLVDFKGLKGDPSDNIPGIIGIGPKTAVDLIKKFGQVENIYKNLDSLPSKLKEKLFASKDQAFFSKSLVQIKTDIDIDFDIKKYQFFNIDLNKTKETLKNFNFLSLVDRVSKIAMDKKEEPIKENLKLC